MRIGDGDDDEDRDWTFPELPLYLYQIVNIDDLQVLQSLTVICSIWSNILGHILKFNIVTNDMFVGT